MSRTPQSGTASSVRPHFYLIGSDIKRGTAWITDSDDYMGESVIWCGACQVRASVPLPQQVVPRVGLRITRPGTLDDIVRLGFQFAVSDKFRRAYKKGGLTGLRFLPFKELVADGDSPRYRATIRLIKEWKLRLAYVVGKGGSIARTSGVTSRVPCKVCNIVYWSHPRRGVHVDTRQWDGSDFFHVEGFGPRLMSQRAVDVLGQAGLTNFTADDASIPWGV